MSTERLIENRFTYLDECERLYDDRGSYVVADFSDNGEKTLNPEVSIFSPVRIPQDWK
ncbi:MAG: hypothetical protein ABEJ56_00950 [Candidatus Nanohaloarchaea archaeon]